MIRERGPLWRDVELGFVPSTDVDVVVMPDCNPVLIAMGELLPPCVVEAIDDGDARVIWWKDGRQVVIGVKVYGETIGVAPIVSIDDPDWRLIAVLKTRPLIDFFVIDGSKTMQEIDRDQDIQFFILHSG